MDTDTRLIAFFLPQFHPIPENNRWWGEGFTEWINVAQAKPLFRGHYQPQIPADLGFYDLRLPETRQAQADLAREYGIQGFCYYHYWFNGKRVLERPFNDVLESGSPDFPFCLCWANENWTRRWDGKDQEVLLNQKYNHEDDRSHIQSLLRAFEDHRYIRIDNKPLFLVYRTESLPDPVKTTEIWREEALRSGVGELFLMNVQSMGSYGDPHEIGFDASVEFAPDWRLRGGVINGRLLGHFKWLFAGLKQFRQGARIYDYRRLVNNMLQKDWPDYPFFRCVCPSWDNTARRKTKATILTNNDPSLYGQWLTRVLQMTQKKHPKEHQIVFINAWNEWAEGCHLEPCQKWGHAYLEATRDSLLKFSKDI